MTTTAPARRQSARDDRSAALNSAATSPSPRTGHASSHSTARLLCPLVDRTDCVGQRTFDHTNNAPNTCPNFARSPDGSRLGAGHLSINVLPPPDLPSLPQLPPPLVDQSANQRRGQLTADPITAQRAEIVAVTKRRMTGCRSGGADCWLSYATSSCAYSLAHQSAIMNR